MASERVAVPCSTLLWRQLDSCAVGWTRWWTGWTGSPFQYQNDYPFSSVIFPKSEAAMLSRTGWWTRRRTGWWMRRQTRWWTSTRGVGTVNGFNSGTLVPSAVRVRSNLVLLYCNSLLLSVNQVLPLAYLILDILKLQTWANFSKQVGRGT